LSAFLNCQATVISPSKRFEQQGFLRQVPRSQNTDLLKHAGISKNATQITVFSPDGFSQSFPIDVPDPQTDPETVQYDVLGPYPYGTYCCVS